MEARSNRVFGREHRINLSERVECGKASFVVWKGECPHRRFVKQVLHSLGKEQLIGEKRTAKIPPGRHVSQPNQMAASYAEFGKRVIKAHAPFITASPCFGRD